MVSTFTWVSMVMVGAIAIVVGLFMLSAYREATKSDKKSNDEKKNRNF